MLSRQAFKSVLMRTASGPELRPLAANYTQIRIKNAPPPPKLGAVSPWEGPERDLVNFPKRKFPRNPDPVRLGFLPASWFEFFHKKTGVTGPYVFFGSVGTLLLSKEWFVLEHEFYVGVGLFIVFSGLYYKSGPLVEYVEKGMEEEERVKMSVKQDEIDKCTAAITEEEKAQWMASSYEQLIQAKKENISLQLEAAYRERLQEAYQQVKRRLDYQLELSNVMRRVEQRHMVDWIMESVRKSITAKQEEDALKKCISDLKGLAKA